MKATIILALILLIRSPFCAGFSCPDTLISDAQTFGCTGTNTRLFDSSLLHLASDQQALTVTFDIKVTDTCSNTAPMHLATLTTGAPGSEIRLMDFIWNGSAINLQSSNTTMTGTFLSSAVSTLTGSWLSLAISLNISSGICGGATLTPSGLAADYSTYIYDGIALDSTIKLSMCSDIGGASPFACQVTNLKVIYTLYTSRSPLVLGQSPVVIGVYKFKEATGWTTKNEVNSSQIGYFGESINSTQDTTHSPQWIPPGIGYGVQFTDRSQYIRLSALDYGLVNNRPASLSLAVYFWIKVEQFPVSVGTNDPIFRSISSDAATTRLGFFVRSDGKVVTAMGPTLSTSIISLTLSTWTQVSVRFSLLDTANLPGYRMVNFGSSIAITSNYVNTTLRTTDFISSDVFRVGEFIGMISDFRIFSPASMAVNIPTCSPTCNLDVGNTNPPTCIKPECGAGEYVSPSYCVACPITCATCTDTGLCQTCPPGNILSAGNCTVCAPGTYAASPTASTCTTCPNRCETCTSATQCQSCSVGFFLSGKSCIPCPTGCKACTSSNQCQSCSTGYALSPTVCTPCPDGTYALSDTAPTCEGNCPDNCLLCPDSLTCQTCITGYERQGGVCTKIPEGPEQNVGLPSNEQPVLTEITNPHRAPWVLISLLIIAILVAIALITYYVKRRWFKNSSMIKFIKEAFSNWSKGLFKNRRARLKVAQSPSSQEISNPDTIISPASQKYKAETEEAI